MLDFAKIREENAKRAKAPLATPIAQKKLNWLERINHLIDYHLADTTVWEEDFLYSIRRYLVIVVKEEQRFDSALSVKVKEKITSMEHDFCGSICHALNKAEIFHN